ncbi:MAG: hypothetical protein SPK87_00280 [Bacteroidales bacterium]|nr:hypothetical protein [Bacteroidales bacterium]
MNKKKIYQKSAMRVVVLKHQPLLQTGSPGGDMYYIPRHDDDLNHMA